MIILLVRVVVGLLKDIVKFEWLFYLVFVALVVFGISLCDELNDRFKRIPYGPMRVPLLGNYFQLKWNGGRHPYRAVTKMSKGYYNGFMKVFFGLTGYISVNGNERILEVTNSEEFSGEREDTWRLDRTETEKKSTEPTSIIPNEKDLTPEASMAIWVSRRNIAIRCLKEQIFSKKAALNELITKQVQELLKGIESQEKVDKNSVREINSDVFLPYILSTVWSVLTGNEAMSVTDRRIQTLHRCLKDWEQRSIEFSGPSDYFPFLVRWFPGWTGFNKLKEINEDFRKLLKGLIKEQYAKAEVTKQNPESFVQACIREFKNLRKQSFGGEQMNDSSSIALLFEFLCPGPLVSSSQVGFALSLAARDAKAQARIVAEINDNFPNDQVPTIDKSDKLPFTTAFILETARFSSVVPWERRRLLKTLTIDGSRYPKAMQLLLNYHSANFDEKIWQNPQVFDPERFLSPTGKIINEEKLLSSAAERNLCAGQPLLKMILFSFLTGTLQKFKFELSPNFKDKGPEFGIINRPQPFKVVLKPRFS